jgi:hypothetical protein
VGDLPASGVFSVRADSLRRPPVKVGESGEYESIAISFEKLPFGLAFAERLM